MKPRLCVRVKPHNGWSSYRAWSDGIVFKGETMGYTNDVEEILRRMVRAASEPPEAVVKVSKLLFEHFAAHLQYSNLMYEDFIGTAVEYDDPESPYRSFTLYIEITTQQIDVMDHIIVDGKEDLGQAEPGWMVTITVTYKGNDGNGIGVHMIKRELLFKGRVDPNTVWSEMMRVIRYAVNVLPTE